MKRILAALAAAAALAASAAPAAEGGGARGSAEAMGRILEYSRTLENIVSEAAGEAAVRAPFGSDDARAVLAAQAALADAGGRAGPCRPDMRIFDRDFKVLAHAGNAVPGSESAEILSALSAAFEAGSVRTVLAYGAYWILGAARKIDETRAVAALAPLGLRFPSLAVLGMDQGLLGRLGADLDGSAHLCEKLLPEPGEEPNPLDDFTPFPKEGPAAGAGLGVYFAPNPAPEGGFPSPWISAAVSALLGAAFLLALRRLYRGGAAPGPGRFAVFAALCIAFRAGLCAAGFPGSVLGGRLFSRGLFDAHLPMGLASSPGDFLLTVATLSAVFLVFLRHCQPTLYDWAEGLAKRRARLAPAALAAPCALAVPLCAILYDRAIAAVLRAGSFQYFPPGRVWPDEVGTAMMIALFLASICFLMGCVTAVNAMSRMLGFAGLRPMIARIASACTVCAGMAAAALPPFSDLLIPSAFIVAVVLASFFLHSALKKERYSFNHVLMFLVASALVCFPSLRRENEESLKERIARTGRELGEAKAYAVAFKLRMAAVKVARDVRLEHLGSGYSVPKFLPALVLAESGLASPEISCHVRLTRYEKIGDYSFNMPFGRESGGTVDAGWEHPSDADFEGLAPGTIISRQGVGDWRGQVFHTVKTFIGNPSDNLAAYITAAVLWPFPLKRAAIPGMPAPFGLGGEEPDLAVSRYVDGRLVLSTSTDMAAGRPLPEGAAVPAQGGEAPVWFEEEVPGGKVEQMLLADLEPAGHAVTAMGFKKQVGWRHVLEFMRLLLIDLAAGGVLFLAFVLAAAPYNPELKGLFRLRFKYRLLITYIAISILPIIVLLFTVENMTEKRVMSSIEAELAQGLEVFRDLLEMDIREEVDASPTGYSRPGMYPEKIMGHFNDEIWYATRSDMLGPDFNVYIGPSFYVGAVSGPFENMLTSRMMPEDVYGRLMLGGERLMFSTRESGGGIDLAGFLKLEDPSGRAFGALSASRHLPSSEIKREISTQLSIIITFYLLTLFGIGVVAVALAGRISRPMERLNAATREIAGGNLDHRIEIDAPDEIGELVDSFNMMTGELKDSRERIIKAEKESAWREMARQIAHEIKNPLTPMKLSTGHILKAHKDKHPRFDAILADGLDRIASQIDALGKIASEFSNFARFPARKLESQDLNPIVFAAVRLVEDEARGSAPAIVFEETYGDLPKVEADRDEMQRVVLNIVKNAVQALREKGGKIRVTTARTPGSNLASRKQPDGKGGKGTKRIAKTERKLGPGAETVEILVEDDGPGIPEDVQKRLFEPYFSTKSGGTGLGLAICKSSVSEMGGEIIIESEEGMGTRVLVLLPARAPEGDNRPAAG